MLTLLVLPAVVLAAALPAVVLAAAQPAVDPRFATNVTVFHVNELKYGAIPINMNTADNVGDLAFDLLEVIIAPMACVPGRPPKPPPDPCTNPEATGRDLVVNMITLEVDSRFSKYGQCNIGINGTDPFGNPCPTGKYCCACHTSPSSHKVVPCNDTLGYMDVREYFRSIVKIGDTCQPNEYMPSPTTSDCYMQNSISKLTAADHGSWFSSIEHGFCDAKHGACTWRVVSIDKIVRRECHTRVFGEMVQSRGAPECLDACGAQRTNITSPCWVDCFYKAALGRDAGKIGGATAGMTLEELKKAWMRPFQEERFGGCPPVRTRDESEESHLQSQR